MKQMYEGKRPAIKQVIRVVSHASTLLLVLRIIYLIFLLLNGIYFTTLFNKKDEVDSRRIRYIWQTWTGDRGIWPAVEDVFKAIMMTLVIKYIQSIVIKEAKTDLNELSGTSQKLLSKLVDRSQTMSKPEWNRHDAEVLIKSNSNMRELLDKIKQSSVARAHIDPIPR